MAAKSASETQSFPDCWWKKLLGVTGFFVDTNQNRVYQFNNIILEPTWRYPPKHHLLVSHHLMLNILTPGEPHILLQDPHLFHAQHLALEQCAPPGTRPVPALPPRSAGCGGWTPEGSLQSDRRGPRTRSTHWAGSEPRSNIAMPRRGGA